MTDIDLSDLAADRDGSRKLRGYLASPAGTGPWPAVVMIHEIFGLDDVMRRHADHLAGLGYLTLAVDLFSAGGTARCLVATMTAMIRGHGRAFADIGAARDYLAVLATAPARSASSGSAWAVASRCSAPAMVTTPPPSTTVSFPATSTKRWPVPAQSWPATVAATGRFEVPPAGSTQHSTKQE